MWVVCLDPPRCDPPLVESLNQRGHRRLPLQPSHAPQPQRLRLRLSKLRSLALQLPVVPYDILKLEKSPAMARGFV